MAAPAKGPSSGSKKVLSFKQEFGSIDDFFKRFGADVSYGGIFLRSRNIKEKGTIFNFELKTSDGRDIIDGMGQVVWTR